MVKRYAERDVMGLDRAGNYYCANVEAMTAEGLHDKSDIAAELAYRDHRCAKLEALCDRLADGLDDVYDEEESIYNVYASNAIAAYHEFKEKDDE